MTTQPNAEGYTEAAILTRLVNPGRDDFSAEAASALLKLEFDPEDLNRLHWLASKNQQGTLTAAEKSELEGFLRISSFLDLMHARARQSLKRKRTEES